MREYENAEPHACLIIFTLLGHTMPITLPRVLMLDALLPQNVQKISINTTVPTFNVCWIWLQTTKVAVLPEVALKWCFIHHFCILFHRRGLKILIAKFCHLPRVNCGDVEESPCHPLTYPGLNSCTVLILPPVNTPHTSQTVIIHVRIRPTLFHHMALH